MNKVSDYGPRSDFALRAAYANDRIDNIRLLLKHGADVNLTMKSGSTAIDAAVEAGHEDLVMLLLDGGIDK